MPKPQRKPRLRTIQPPHPSDKFTLEEAIEAWRYADEQLAARARAAEVATDRTDAPTRTPYQTPDEVSG
ncbi:MAG TPA: hypothetical protein VEY93_13520 [Longimicrobium sp.]|nr:hypothetical protein [Longimicrobium sp.]